MTSTVDSVEDLPPPGRRFRVTPAVELAVVAAAIVIAAFSYAALSHVGPSERLIEPPIIALVLVANLVSGVALLMLFGRRLALRRAAASALGGRGRLHVQLVAIFSVVAAVPMLLVTIFASLLFQYGVQFWYSDRARGAFENATALTQSSYAIILQRWEEATATMADDLGAYLQERPIDTRFGKYFAQQVYYRSLSEGALFRVTPSNSIQTLAIVNPYEVNFQQWLTPASIAKLRSGQRSVVVVTGGRIQVFTRLSGTENTYLYAARVSQNPREMTQQTDRAIAAQADYRALLARSRSLQLQFNAALLIISLLIVGLSVWIALAVADRLVRPVAELVGAARRVERGDLTARVPETDTRDEIGTLSNAFNRMTERLESQNTALVTANTQLDSRRALIEAVMSGVSAGVVSIAEDRTIRLINSSAEALLGTGSGSSVGRPLAEVAPELDAMLDQPAREAVVQMTVAGEARTLAVRIARDGTGPILTFDDITQQLLDQRRAAWSDVARRIAHEIKNPLTPIQLAAERLQRRYGKTIDPADTTFARLTDTIVRQVGDLRRMVDEFSSFARMPKPVFRRESLVDIARQTMFLHEVAHTGIAFTLVHDDPGPVLVCDRRQMGQALTNIVKNAVEAIEATGEAGGAVTMTLTEAPDSITIEVADSGVGLPVERDRIVEPYMTTRARGTGLGLAIVKKIVEEHAGTITFADRAEGGTLVCMVFDTRALAAIETDGDASADDLSSDGGQLAALTRNRN
ncbi:Two-component system, NtrC family, nitrogen regulation sensor histidine kinase NtrY [Sphingomonas sp. EC-HK361]|uniref:sensor histidine kinase n=1 Tax=Sphingomonas sp. EC-HK361 TaxID=2038397 RepID=UPI001251EDCE|nr:ATP-binding protein [Sphingomonas sp. EC-HK361]VVT03164.1 Two-component system, NtrC family, nitrogen regulation sensor histidine kinase NtrY [Sphingomonas sp. EC-HK361]